MLTQNNKSFFLFVSRFFMSAERVEKKKSDRNADSEFIRKENRYGE